MTSEVKDGATFDWRLTHKDIIDKMWIKHCDKNPSTCTTEAAKASNKIDFIKKLTLAHVFEFMTCKE